MKLKDILSESLPLIFDKKNIKKSNKKPNRLKKSVYGGFVVGMNVPCGTCDSGDGDGGDSGGDGGGGE